MRDYDVDICDLELSDLNSGEILMNYQGIEITYSNLEIPNRIEEENKIVDFQNLFYFFEDFINPIYQYIKEDIFGKKYLTSMDGCIHSFSFDIIDEQCRDLFGDTIDIIGESMDTAEVIRLLKPEIYTEVAKFIVVDQLNFVLDELVNKKTITISNYTYTLLEEINEEEE